MVASAEFVEDLVNSITALQCDVWLDGGWGVDALLGKETRSHDDVDIVVQAHELDHIHAMLGTRGFALMDRDDTRAWNFVMSDAGEQQIDFHVVEFDQLGNGIYGPVENGVYYPAQAFTGRGQIGGTPVKCMSVEFQIANRSGYALRDKDHHDLKLLRSSI